MDLNVYPFRKGKAAPNPEKWIIQLASEVGIGFCFGDDSHSPDSVGVGIEQGREYLLNCEISEISVLKMNDGVIKVEQPQLGMRI